MLGHGDIQVATYEDLEPAIKDVPLTKRWWQSPCCGSGPGVVVSDPFSHIVYFVCGDCGKMQLNIGATRDSQLPPRELMHPLGNDIFAVELDGQLPSVRFADNREVQVIFGNTIRWTFRVSTEKEVADWKEELGKGEL